ncbi:MAG: HgcAB-like fusion protein, partial [Promethearchaeota archaeon]
DCFLLVAPSKGINVWCGACGDDFNSNSVISILKTSGIDDIVNHRILILPQLGAPGIDPIEIKEKTGWNVKFGPVFAKDIPNYVKNNFKKTVNQRSVRFPILKRIEMANLYFFSLIILFSIFYWIAAPFFTALDFFLYIDSILIIIVIIHGSLLILPNISMKSGKTKVWVYEIVILFFITLLYFLIFSSIFYLAWNSILSIILALIMAEDFHGLTPIYKSELGEKTWKKGKDKMKFLFAEYKLQSYGQIHIKREDCTGCKVCIDVCPMNVYEINDLDNKADIIFQNKCVNCNACVKRCLAHCLSII